MQLKFGGTKIFFFCSFVTEEYDELGRLQRTCNGEVQVNKCEGLCNSQVQPSVITPTGFLKVYIINLGVCFFLLVLGHLVVSFCGLGMLLLPREFPARASSHIDTLL